MPFSSKAFVRSAGATPSREHMSAKASSTRASDSKPAPSAFTILNEFFRQLTDHVFPAGLLLRKKQIELSALVNVVLGDELEVGRYGHYYFAWSGQALAMCRKDNQCSQTDKNEEAVSHEDHPLGEAGPCGLKFQSSRR